MEKEQALKHLLILRIEALERQIQLIKELVDKHPNDQDLGKAIRNHFNETICTTK